MPITSTRRKSKMNVVMETPKIIKFVEPIAETIIESPEGEVSFKIDSAAIAEIREEQPKLETEPEVIEEKVTEEDEEELDLTELGPNPTPQMIELLKRKKMSAKKSPKKKVNGSAKINNSPKVTKNDLSISMPIPRKKPQPPPRPALPYFPGDKDAKIFFVEGDPSRFSANDFVKIPKANLESFQGVNFTFLHTPVDWKPTDIFKLFQSVRTVNQKAGLESYLIMVSLNFQFQD